MRLGDADARDPETDADTLRLMDDERRGGAALRPARPWVLIAAALMLVVLAVVLWAKWSESRTEAQQLRAELKNVYVEAEGLRTQAAQAQQQVALLEQQVRALTAERTEILKRLEAAGTTSPKAKSKPAAKPAPKAAAKPARLARTPSP